MCVFPDCVFIEQSLLDCSCIEFDSRSHRPYRNCRERKSKLDTQNEIRERYGGAGADWLGGWVSGTRGFGLETKMKKGDRGVVWALKELIKSETDETQERSHTIAENFATVGLTRVTIAAVICITPGLRQRGLRCTHRITLISEESEHRESPLSSSRTKLSLRIRTGDGFSGIGDKIKRISIYK